LLYAAAETTTSITDMEKPEIELYHPVTYLEGSQDDKDEETWTEEEEKALRRKLDYHIVPLITILYLLCFVCPHLLPSTPLLSIKYQNPENQKI
jgi:hypothetical protein